MTAPYYELLILEHWALRNNRPDIRAALDRNVAKATFSDHGGEDWLEVTLGDGRHILAAFKNGDCSEVYIRPKERPLVMLFGLVLLGLIWYGVWCVVT